MFKLNQMIKAVREGTGFVPVLVAMAFIALTLGASFLLIYLCTEQYRESAAFGLVLGFLGASLGLSAANLPKLLKQLIVFALICFVGRSLVFSFLDIANGSILILHSAIFAITLFISGSGFGISFFCVQGILNAEPLKTVKCTQCKLHAPRKQ